VAAGGTHRAQKLAFGVLCGYFPKMKAQPPVDQKRIALAPARHRQAADQHYAAAELEFMFDLLYRQRRERKVAPLDIRNSQTARLHAGERRVELCISCADRR